MRTEKEIYDLVLNFAFQDERIRIVTLEGLALMLIYQKTIFKIMILLFVIDMGEFFEKR